MNWYTIAARGRALPTGLHGVADISLHNDIGGRGISAADFIADLKAMGDLSRINLSIHSNGGEISDGIAIYNALRKHPAKVIATIEGMAASMASVIAMAADEIIMPANTMLMLHNPGGSVSGEARAIRRYAAVMDDLKEQLISAYQSKSGLSREEISALMDEETFLTAEEAVRLGLADTLLEEERMAARLDLSTYANAPQVQPWADLPPGTGNMVKIDNAAEGVNKQKNAAPTAQEEPTVITLPESTDPDAAPIVVPVPADEVVVLDTPEGIPDVVIVPMEQRMDSVEARLDTIQNFLSPTGAVEEEDEDKKKKFPPTDAKPSPSIAMQMAHMQGQITAQNEMLRTKIPGAAVEAVLDDGPAPIATFAQAKAKALDGITDNLVRVGTSKTFHREHGANEAEYNARHNLPAPT